MATDLTEKIIQPGNSAARPVRIHPLRRGVQVLLAVLSVVAPFTNLFRIDIRTDRLWVLGQDFSAHNALMLFYVFSLFALVVISISLVYGRMWWCGFTCPQTIVSDFADSARQRLRKLTHAHWSRTRSVLSTSLWLSLMAVAAVATSATCVSYFYAPATVWQTVVAPTTDIGISTAVGILALFCFADLVAIRRHFCKTACPYGFMLGVLGDQHTMTVRYLWERGEDCISCKKCVRVCPVGIDIREGPNQFECIGCGECIDACNDILPRIKSNPKPGLIELRFGLDPMRRKERMTVFQRLGLWDGKRGLVAVVTLTLIVGFMAERFGSYGVLATISPLGTIAGDSRSIHETYQLILTNQTSSSVRMSLSVAGIPGVGIYQPADVVEVDAKSEKQLTLGISAPRAALVADRRYPVSIVARTTSGPAAMSKAATFFYVPGF